MSTAEEFGNFATTNMISEATAFKTVRTGQYDLQITKTYEINKEEGWARLGGKVVSEGMVRGNVFFRVQWKEERGTNGKLKTKCKLYAQLLKALHPTSSIDELSKIDAETLLSEAEKYPIRAFVSEFYKVPDATNQYGSRRVYANTPEEVKAALEKGGVAGNDVMTISPAKG